MDSLQSHRDFVRQSQLDLRQTRRLRSVWHLIHIDPVLLVGLLLLCGFGLFILYSATAGDIGVVRRQAAIMGGGFVLMAVLAQFDVQFYRRWAPTAYIGALAVLALLR